MVAVSFATQAIAPTPPPFCQGFAPKPQEQAMWVHTDLATSGVTAKALHHMAQGWCEKPDDPARQAEAAQWRQTVADAWGLSAEETLDSLRVRLASPEPEALKETCEALAQGADELARARADAAVLGELVGCEEPPGENQVDLVANLSDALNPLWRAGHAVRCYEVLERRVSANHAAREYARCRLEASLFKDDEFEQALARDERFNDVAKVLAREALRRLRLSERRFDDLWAKELKANAVLEPVVAAAAEGYARWVASRQAKSAVWSELLKVEMQALDSPKGVPEKNCQTALRPLVPRVFTGGKVSRTEWAPYWLADPLRPRFMKTLIACELLDHPEWQRALIFMVPHTVEPVGPLQAADAAVLAKAKATMADRPKFPWSKYGFDVREEDDFQRTQSWFHTESFDEAPIASLAPKGANVLVTFRQTAWNEPTLNCVATNKVSRIDPVSGNVSYEQNCSNGPVLRHTHKQAPVLVPKEYATGLKPGQLLVFSQAPDGAKAPVCVPLVSYANEKKEAFVTVLGQPVN